ncbi:MAG: TraM recognition domain-containing protein [Actinomycetaceae bacterium]|nr:TraM recognition domain-containing protein [Actinomycetaceae bacterium]
MSTRRESTLWEPSTVFMILGIGVVVTLSLIVTVGAHLWAAFNGVTDVSWNPFTLMLALMDQSLDPSGQAGWWMAATGGVILVLVVATTVLVVRSRRGKTRRGDRAARLAGRGSDIAPITKGAVKAKAQRLGIKDAVGLPVGRTVAGDAQVMSSFEDVCLTVAGPRTGKTTAWVVPRIFAAPGAVVATSNKRDIVDETKQRRVEQTGQRAWVFDPQNLAGATQSWWWNPLSYVTDFVQATALADVFFSAGTPNGGKGKNEWESWSCNLIAAMLLAAARGGLPITVLHRWLNDQTDDEPVLILRAKGENMSATSLQGILDLVPETRSGVYGGASRIMNFLNNDSLMRWVTPVEGLDEFDPAEFVKTKQTLYCLSQEGRGSATQVVTALTVAVVEEAVKYAAAQQGGRLSVPMLIELDEAANVCRWAELPDQYSHFGSRGICVDTVLQSWSQGTSVWGEAGMKKLWSAANLKVYGGGVSEPEFLRLVSDLIGVHYVDSMQVSSSPQGRSYSTSKGSQQRPIATVADLQALPQGRAWVFASGAVATLIRLIPFWEQPQLSEVQN